MTKHAWLHPWNASTGMCFNAKRVDMAKNMVEGGFIEGGFIGPIYIAGPGDLCGHCLRGLESLKNDLDVFLHNSSLEVKHG